MSEKTEIFNEQEVEALSAISKANSAYAGNPSPDAEVQSAFSRHLAISQRLVIRGSIRRRNADKPRKPKAEAPAAEPAQA